MPVLLFKFRNTTPSFLFIFPNVFKDCIPFCQAASSMFFLSPCIRSFPLHTLSQCTFSALVQMWIQLRRIYLVFQLQSPQWHWVFPRILLLSRCWFAITPQSNSIPGLYLPQSLPNNDLTVDLLVINPWIPVLEFHFSGIPLLSFLKPQELCTLLVIWCLSLHLCLWYFRFHAHTSWF